MERQPLLGTWFVAGFEGSTHRRLDGRRLDLVASTRHDELVDLDYVRMAKLGIGGAREALRWHLAEPEPRRYRLDVERRRIEAAARHGVTVAWDLCHFGWPDHVDPLDADFPAIYAAWAFEVARVLRSDASAPHWIAPQNEMSFLAWAGGEVGVMNPGARGAGDRLKRQLAAGAIAAIDAVRAELPDARFLHPEPLINVAADSDRPHERHHAAQATEVQYEAWDMLAGRIAPEIGGSEAHLDVLGANYYPDNQWNVDGAPLALAAAERVSLADLLVDLHRRYGRPILISETGAEDALRGPWLRSVTSDVDAAAAQGVPMGGICLYPILNHPGWEDDRHCRNGVWDYPGPLGGRAAHRPMVRHVREVARSLS